MFDSILAGFVVATSGVALAFLGFWFCEAVFGDKGDDQ